MVTLKKGDVERQDSVLLLRDGPDCPGNSCQCSDMHLVHSCIPVTPSRFPPPKKEQQVPDLLALRRTARRPAAPGSELEAESRTDGRRSLVAGRQVEAGVF